MTPVAASLAADLEAIPGLRVRTDFELARLTTFKIGGPVSVLVTPESEEALAAAMGPVLDSGQPVAILGNGSNLLIADAGFPGVVLRVGSSLGGVTPDGDAVLRVGAGSLWSKVLHFLQKEGWTGLEFGAGIPGTVGGAVATNAGTRGGETADRLLDVRGVGPDGEIRTIARDDIPFVYRKGPLPEGFVVMSIRFSAERADPERITTTIQGYQAERRRDQPEREPSAGCMFKNPPGQSAGRLIDEAGLKGITEGAAIVSRVHGNFIINQGGATSDDVLRLVNRIRERILAEHGVELELEVRLVGLEV